MKDPLFAALSCLALPRVCHGMVVHSIVIQSCQSSWSTATSQPSPSSNELVIFLHGRLEADDDEDIFIPEPSQLYGDFLSGLSQKIPANSEILMPAYHAHYQDWKHEPRDLTLGPVTSAISQVIHDHLKSTERDSIKLTMVSFSMGAAILIKLMASDPILSSAKNSGVDVGINCSVNIQRLILIEPVWRCWLPFAVSEAASLVGDPTRDCIISDLPTLAIAGTNDDEVGHDSGCMGQTSMDGVRRSLRPFLPNTKVSEIEAGNHFGGLCSGVDDIAMGNLGEGVTLPSLRDEIISRIAYFSGWNSLNTPSYNHAVLYYKLHFSRS